MENMDLRIQVPGLGYFSIVLIPEPRRHTLWGFLGRIPRRVAHLFYPVVTPAFPSLIVAQSGGGDDFFISSVVDSVLNVARRWSPFASALGSVALS